MRGKEGVPPAIKIPVCVGGVNVFKQVKQVSGHGIGLGRGGNYYLYPRHQAVKDL
jgi:hypothetical protein